MMRRFFPSVMRLLILGLSVLAVPPDSGAHGTAYTLVKEASLTAVQFRYSDGEPMAYAEVLVFGPKDPKVEHQNGRTDRHGRFAFCPDAEGAWRISADDGMGHLCEAMVEIGPPRAASAEEAVRPRGDSDMGGLAQRSKALKIVTGLSLICNLAFAVQFFHERAKNSKRRLEKGDRHEET